MKKAIFSLFLLPCLLNAFSYDAKFYMGMGGGVQYEKFTDEKKTHNTPAFGALKFGYGDRRAYAVEFDINYVDNKSSIFSKNDKERYGMDIMFVKAYNFTKFLYPFFRAGIGAGEMKVKRKLESKIAYSSYNLGAGAFFPLSGHLDIEANYEYRFTSYESVDLIAQKLKLQSHINQIYLGVNYRF